MGKFRDNRIALLEAQMLNFIDDEEFILLYDINLSHNPDLPYWNYERFNLENLSDEKCKIINVNFDI